MSHEAHLLPPSPTRRRIGSWQAFPSTLLVVGTLGVLAMAAQAGLPANFHRGVCVEGGPELQQANIDELVALGVTHVSLNPFGWMESVDRPKIRFATGRGEHRGRWWGESDEGLRQYAKLARRHGISVMLRPHLWLSNPTDHSGRSGLWLGDVGFSTDEEWREFFDQYLRFCLHYAGVAEEAGMEWYSVGAELTRTTLERPDEWRKLISEVRKVYHGKLIYSGNWWREAEGITFWDALDAIGVQAYFPVATGPDSTEEEMVAAWKKPLASLGAISRNTGRPILFTEIGYRAAADGAVKPWEWSGGGPPRPDVQARAYRAVFRALADVPEVQGLYWWKYHVAPARGGSWNGDERRTAFSWQGKEAESVLREAYRSRP